MKFPPFTPVIARKAMKLVCCDRCDRAEWIEAMATASFCRCGTRRRAATKGEVEKCRASHVAAAQAAAKADSGSAQGEA